MSIQKMLILIITDAIYMIEYYHIKNMALLNA